MVEMRYYTMAEAASILTVSQRTVQRLIARGELPAFRVGRLIRVSEVQLEEYIAASTGQRRPVREVGYVKVVPRRKTSRSARFRVVPPPS